MNWQYRTDVHVVVVVLEVVVVVVVRVVMLAVVVVVVEVVVVEVGSIPDICHFFTLAKFLEDKIYTEKRQFFALNL